MILSKSADGKESNVNAKMFLTTPAPCQKVELQDFRINGHDISINVKVAPPSPDTICVQVLKEHLLEQKIGTLKAEAYTARLYVNAEQREFATDEIVTVPEFPAAPVVLAASLAALAVYRFRNNL